LTSASAWSRHPPVVAEVVPGLVGLGWVESSEPAVHAARRIRSAETSRRGERLDLGGVIGGGC
jgi:hypothetical protein